MQTIEISSTTAIPIDVKPGLFGFHISKESGDGKLKLRRRPAGTSNAYQDVGGMSVSISNGGDARSLDLLVGETEATDFDWQLVPSSVSTSDMYYGYGRRAADVTL